MKLTPPILAFAVAALGGSHAQAQLPERIEMPLTDHGYCSIHYPKGFDPTEAYHLLYWFHGTSGRPNPGIGDSHEAYVTVGMSYRKRENVEPGKYGSNHWEDCLAVRSQLEKAGLRTRRNVVAGMSKGGWTGFYIGEEEPNGPHAIAIFAAGKDPRYGRSERLASGLSVLVGVGETDPNYPQSQLAVEFFGQGGARVCYEEWLGKGHTYHASPRVLAWLEVESLKDQPERLREFADQTLKTELKRTEAIEDPLEHYLSLRFLLGHPATPYSEPDLQQDLRNRGRNAAAESQVAEWLVSHQELQSLVRKEAEFFDSRSFELGPIETLANRYHSLAESITHPSLAARAAYGGRRARKMHAIYQAQMKARENPEYETLSKRYAELQKIYSDKNGKPGDEVMAELNEIGAKLSDLRFNSSMGAFVDNERKSPDSDSVLDAAIKADQEGKVRGWIGLGF